MISPRDLRARNDLFERAVEAGLTWTSGEAPDGVPTIYLPVRDATLVRVSVYPASERWILRYITQLRQTATVTVDKLSRDPNAVLVAIGSALGLAFDSIVDDEPQSALALVGLLGAIAVATEDDTLLALAGSSKRRAIETSNVRDSA